MIRERLRVLREHGWSSYRSVVESVKGERFADFRDRHGDWGLAMVFHLSRQHSGLTLHQIGEMAGGMAYKTVFARIKYLKVKMRMDSSLASIINAPP